MTNIVRKVWTNTPIVTLERKPITGHFKPRGLWYEINGEWVDWCQNEQPDWLKNGHHELVFVADAKIAVLTNPQEVRSFNETYRNAKSRFSEIDWERVAQDYDGIEIRNYWNMADLRFESNLMWFYGWDCSSGCVWNPEVVRLSEYRPGKPPLRLEDTSDGTLLLPEHMEV